MKRRYLAVCMLLAVVVWVPAGAAAQSAESATSPRTPWGDPDLQGIWNNATLTPLQRPDELVDQVFLTEEEAANLQQRTVGRNARLLTAPAQRTEAGGNVGAYNNFWMERGTTVVPTRRTSLIVDPPDGKLPALTPEADRRINSPESRRIADMRGGRSPVDSWETLDLGDRCLWYRGIPSFPTGYNNNYHIVQNPEFVAILQEHIHDVRFIPLDGRPHVAGDIRQYAGDSRGRWEGDTLVVETTNFNDQAFIRNFNGNLSEALHVVERYTPAGPDHLNYEVTIEDPTVFTRPWKMSMPLYRRQEANIQLLEYECYAYAEEELADRR